MLCLAVLPSADSSPPIRALHRFALIGLESRQSRGVHVVVPPLHASLHDIYVASGFADVSEMWARKDGCRVFGKRLGGGAME